MSGKAGARASRHLLVLLCALGAACAAGATVAHSQAYPVRPIRLIVPFPPGGGNDTMARTIGARLTESWGQQTIIDNRAGANGMVAASLVATSAPDGYTLFMANAGSHGINPTLYRKLSYDAVRDFTAVALLGVTPNVLVVHPTMQVGRMSDLVALARAKPGQITYGSNGSGSTQHLAGVMLSTGFGIDLIHVPYKGTGPALIDLMGGQISMSFSNTLAVLQHIKSGKLKALAVTGAKRSAVLPDVPAVAESLPGFQAVSWWGLAAPARTPPAIVNAINSEVGRHLASAAMKEQLDRQGVEPGIMTPAEFSEFIKSEIAKWGKVVKASGARAD